MGRWLTTSKWPRLVAVSLLAAVIAASAVFTAGRRHRLQGSFREAGKHWDRGDYDKAIEFYQRIVDDYADNALSHQAQYQIGTSYYLFLQKEREAIAAFRDLVRRAPGSPWSLKAQMLLGEIYEKRFGDHQQAIIEYQRLANMARQGPMADEGQLAVARGYFHLGDINQARAEYEVHLERFPGSPNTGKALAGLANCYYVRRSYGSAIRAYRRVLEVTEDGNLRAEAAFGIAVSLEEAGETRQALAEFEKIIGEHPNPDLIEDRIRRLRGKVGGGEGDNGGGQGSE